MPAKRDPYEVLGVSTGVTDAELRAAYRRLVKQHHPDHNHGSEASEERFEEVQDAYARIVEMRKRGTGATGRTGSTGASGARRSSAPPPPPPDPDLERRMADLERELHQAREAKERARGREELRFQPH